MKKLRLYYIFLFTLPVTTLLLYFLAYYSQVKLFTFIKADQLMASIMYVLFLMIAFASLVLIASSLIIFAVSVFVKSWTEEFPFAKKIIVVGLTGFIMAFISFFVLSFVQSFFGLTIHCLMLPCLDTSSCVTPPGC
jgi:hypothetical protein